MTTTQMVALDRAAGIRLGRYWEQNDERDLAEAIKLYRRALTIAVPTELPGAVDPAITGAIANNLGRALESRFDVDSSRGDLDEAIDCYRQALRSVGAVHRRTVRGQLAIALRKRHHEDQNTADLSAALTLLTRLTADPKADPETRSEWLRELAGALLDRYELRRSSRDLERAVTCARAALEASGTDGDAGVAGRTSLANTLLVRAEDQARRPDLDEAIELYEQSVRAAAGEHSDPSPVTAANLASALIQRWHESGDHDDLDRSVELYEAAAASTVVGPRSRPGLQVSLGTALDERFHARGAVDDIDRAIELYRTALNATPMTGTDRAGRLNNLAIALRTRHLRVDPEAETADLKEALRLHREALDLIPPRGAARAAVLNSLGSDLRASFDASGAIDHLNEAVHCFDQAARLAPQGSAERASYLNNLSAALGQRGSATNDDFSIRAAIEAAAEAVSLVPTQAPYRATYQLNLANALSDLADRGAGRAVVARATRLFRASSRRALLTAPGNALAATLNWSEWATGRRAWHQVIEAGEIGSSATSRLLSTQVLRTHQESWLRDAQELVTRHVWALIRLRRLPAAAETLEMGRAILLSEALLHDHRRFEELAATGQPGLAERFRRGALRVEALQRQLEQSVEKVIE